MSTLRRQMIEMLRAGPMDLRELALALGIDEKEAAVHLSHAAKSISRRGARLIVQWATCRNCGFEFKERRRFTPPGRCPQCKQSRIDGPFYQVSGGQ
jgi:transcriptional regulator